MPEIVLQPMRWSKLPNIDDVEPLNDSDEFVLDEIRKVLGKHGALDRFGICLLHNHFEMKYGEYLLEDTDEDARTQTITVDSDTDPDRGAIQTMWKFAQDGIENVTVCVLRCKYFLGHKQKHEKQGR